MRIDTVELRGSVLPTVVVASAVILTAMLGLIMLWQMETLSYARSCRLRQARADAESAYTLYARHPNDSTITASDGFRLYDSLPLSAVRIEVRPWGLYEAVAVTTGDSLLRQCLLFGVRPDTVATLYYADNRSALTLAGRTELHGELRLPRNGVRYGRVGQDFFCGREIDMPAIRRAEEVLPQPDPLVLDRVAAMFALAAKTPSAGVPDSLWRSFRDTTLRFGVGDAEIGNCSLRGNILFCAEELRIDSTCRIGHLVVCARKVTVGAGARIAAQIFARDTVVVEPRALLEYPSGIYAQEYVDVGDKAEVNGYVIVRDTVVRPSVSANYRQARTARVRGLVWVDGIAQVQGIVSGQLMIRQAAYFSPQGYYKDLLYDATLLVNPYTATPVWLPSSGRRKEAGCAG